MDKKSNITNQTFMSRRDIFKELPIPSEVPEKEILKYIYKGVYICIKLFLDMRLNMVKLSEGKKISTKHVEKGKVSHKKTNRTVDNPVIKNTDKIEVKDEKKKTDKKTDK